MDKAMNYLTTKWIYAEEVIPRRIFKFLGMKVKKTHVAKFEDVMIALKIAKEDALK